MAENVQVMVEDLSKKRLDLTTCKKCKKICKSKQGLSIHLNTCLKTGVSFLKNERIHLNLSVNPKVGSSDDKILPLSQPLYMEEDPMLNQINIDSMQPHITENITENNSQDVQSTSIDGVDHNCPVCRENVIILQSGIRCFDCNTWFHKTCLHLNQDQYSDVWSCMRCLSIKSNKIKWGNLEGEMKIKEKVSSVYKEVTTWYKNLFILPRGRVGCEFIKELTNTLNQFNNNDGKWSRLSIPMLHIFIPIMLQKPSKKSKAKTNEQYLQKRMNWWRQGDIDSIMSECREIQKRLKKNLDQKKEAKEKAFCRLMLLGKVGQAMKFINSEDPTNGVHEMTDEIKQILQEKHPEGAPASPEALLPDVAEIPESVIYESIDADAVYRAAKFIQGSGGPTMFDSEGWRHILCSKSYGKHSTELCDAIANFAKKLCTQNIHSECLKEFVSCRLIPLDKGNDSEGKPGVRPIGVGEILRRIVGKVVVSCIKTDIIEASGILQTCAGLQSGIEASIHAIREIFEKEPTTEAVLLVDAENAFNKLNRKAALHNVKQLCPPFYKFLSNTYQQAADLHINDHKRSEIILSDEGSTQGDVAAMGMYAIGTRPLIDKLHQKIVNTTCRQVWYADDSSAIGKILDIKIWWDLLFKSGPCYGYYPKPSKTVLIVKHEEDVELAREIFHDTGIQITTSGERHLGAVIGSSAFREEYINEKIDKWIEDIKELANIGKDEPQLAYAAYNKSLCMRWNFIQRTIPNIELHFERVEEAIKEIFIPSIIGRKVSDIERQIIALPTRYGGLGILNPVETSKIEYETSIRVTKHLTELICRQEQNFENYNGDRVKAELRVCKNEKEEKIKCRYELLLDKVNAEMKRSVELACEKGASSWLNAMPIQSLGYVLNKQEFRDGIYLRYGWRIPNTPSYCNCGEKNSVDHVLNCKLGGYVSLRHNAIRDLEAELLKDICKDVKVEPELLPIGNEMIGGTTADKSRLDISAVGVWSSLERSFFDVRIMHPNSESYKNKTPQQLYLMQENEKKRKYNQRIIQVEKGTFTPLIFSTSGGMGPESTKYHRRVAELLSKKKNESFADTINFIRTRLRFCLLRSTLVAVRGERGRKVKKSLPLSDISLNLIPETRE